MAYFILLRFSKGKIFTRAVAKLLFNYVFKLYSLPKEIVLDQDRWFTLNVAQELYRLA